MTATEQLTVRWAKEGEGPEIQAILQADGWNPLNELDWSKCETSWFVAERDGLLLGAVQVCMGIPVARLEMLAIDPLLSQSERAIVMRDLMAHAQLAAKMFGATAVSFMIGDDMTGFQYIVTRRGAVRISTGGIFIRRIA